jgi:hypothetical protein
LRMRAEDDLPGRPGLWLGARRLRRRHWVRQLCPRIHLQPERPVRMRARDGVSSGSKFRHGAGWLRRHDQLWRVPASYRSEVPDGSVLVPGSDEVLRGTSVRHRARRVRLHD